MNNTFTAANSPVSKALYPYPERVFVALAFLTIFIFGTFGNSLVILSVLLSKKLQTRTNAFVVSLSITDLLTSLSLLASVCALLGRNGWPLPEGSEWFCSLSAFILFINGGVCLYTLSAIAVNRMILITRPKMYFQLYSPCKLTAMLIITWTIPILVILIPPLFGIGGLGYDAEDTTCSDLDQHPHAELYNKIHTIFYYPGPLAVIVVCYSRTFWFLKKHFKSQRRGTELRSLALKSSTTHSSSEHLDKPEETTRDRQTLLKMQEIQITRNLFLVVILFVLFFTPYFLSVVIPGGRRVALFAGIFVVGSSAVNPILYSLKHPHFKIVLRAIIKRDWQNFPEPTPLLLRFCSSQAELSYYI